jgi:hypothetical protein
MAELFAESGWFRERDETIKGGDGEHAGSMVNRWDWWLEKRRQMQEFLHCDANNAPSVEMTKFR